MSVHSTQDTRRHNSEQSIETPASVGLVATVRESSQKYDSDGERREDIPHKKHRDNVIFLSGTSCFLSVPVFI